MKYLISLPPNVVHDFHELERKNKKQWYDDSDPKGKQAGSGGGTAHILQHCWESENHPAFLKWNHENEKIIIHG